MKVLLLGGTGFIGRAAARSLREQEHEVVSVGRSADADLILDPTDPSALDAALAGAPDVVVNLLGAGLGSAAADEATMRRVNSDFPTQLRRAMAGRLPGALLVHAASSTERTRGQEQDESVYSATKHAGTQRLRDEAQSGPVPVTILTIHNAYGVGQPVQRFVAATVSALAAGQPVNLVHPRRVRDFVVVDEVAGSITRAIELQPTGLTEIQIGTGRGLALRDAAHTIADALGRSRDLVRATGPDQSDPNPVTVAPVLGGTYGLCTTDFREGVRRMIQEA